LFSFIFCRSVTPRKTDKLKALTLDQLNSREFDLQRELESIERELAKVNVWWTCGCFLFWLIIFGEIVGRRSRGVVPLRKEKTSWKWKTNRKFKSKFNRPIRSYTWWVILVSISVWLIEIMIVFSIYLEQQFCFNEHGKFWPEAHFR
jgi:hypothetical protein